MSKKIKTLEKESLGWKQRWETSQNAVLEMCGDKQTADSRFLAVQRQLAHMQSLCRTLQVTERTSSSLVRASTENTRLDLKARFYLIRLKRRNNHIAHLRLPTERTT